MINFRKRLRPHKTKSVKDKSSDDDEVEWVQTAVAVAGLGLSLMEKHEQDKANKRLKKDLEMKQSQAGRGLDAVNQTLDASLGLFQDRKKQDREFLTENTNAKLKQNLDEVRNSGSTLASTGTDVSQDINKSLWSSYSQGSLKLDRQEENAKLGAYSSAFKSAADIRTQMSEIDAQINSLS